MGTYIVYAQSAIVPLYLKIADTSLESQRVTCRLVTARRSLSICHQLDNEGKSNKWQWAGDEPSLTRPPTEEKKYQ